MKYFPKVLHPFSASSRRLTIAGSSRTSEIIDKNRTGVFFFSLAAAGIPEFRRFTRKFYDSVSTLFLFLSSLPFFFLSFYPAGLRFA